MMLGPVLTESAILKQKLLFMCCENRPLYHSVYPDNCIWSKTFWTRGKVYIITKGPYLPDDLNSSYTLVVVLPLMNK